MILFGHPTGNPNSHQAALAHFEAGRLGAFCLPWMPTPQQLSSLSALPGLKAWAARLSRRCFSPLLPAPRIEGKISEWGRMIRRVMVPQWADEGLSYEANDWLMKTMARESNRPQITAVHSYEDCSLLQFLEAKRQGKACIYDMPIGYYPAWESKQKRLAIEHSDWLPAQGLASSRYARPEQKQKEMDLADIVLAPSSFVRRTIHEYIGKNVALAPYGVDLEFWAPSTKEEVIDKPLTFIYAGQCSLRKGTHILLEAWKRANLNDAVLELVGLWQLAERKRSELPTNVRLTGPVSKESLRERYQSADVFVLPSYFEGFALASLEAMSCGLPIIATEVLDGMELVTESTGRKVPAGNPDALTASLEWFSQNRDMIVGMKLAARLAVSKFTWEHYRNCVANAVTPFV